MVRVHGPGTDWSLLVIDKLTFDDTKILTLKIFAVIPDPSHARVTQIFESYPWRSWVAARSKIVKYRFL